MKNSIKLVIVFGLLFVMNGCTGKSDYQLVQTERDVQNVHTSARSIEYKILKQDRLQIVLYKDPQQTSEVGGSISESLNSDKGVLVDTAGNIALPLIGRVNVAGLTQTQAAKLLERKYRTYLTDPTLNLEVINKRIYVLGEVKKPGVVKLDKEKLTIIEAVAFAGDFTNSAVRNNIIVISHNAQNQMTMRKVDMTSFNSMSLSNMVIKPNDIIYVQPNKWKTFKVASNDVMSVLDPISKLIGTYASVKYLTD